MGCPLCPGGKGVRCKAGLLQRDQRCDQTAIGAGGQRRTGTRRVCRDDDIGLPGNAQTLFIFVILCRWSVSPLASVAQSVDAFDETRARIEDIGEVVNLPEEEGRTGHGVRTPFQGHLQFWNVTFKYPGAASPALQEISFEVTGGTTLGIVGRSGSGKSTITRLLQGLHSNYDGLIKIDGVDMREYNIDHLRGSLGVVLQENFLFHGTIRENIIAAKTAATYDEVVRAARLAGAEEFIDRLPQGL